MIEDNTFYVLVPTAVYDHGVAGVFDTYEEASKAAEELWENTDGHHRFRIDEREIGKVYHTFQKDFYFKDEPLNEHEQQKVDYDRNRLEQTDGFTVIVREHEDI